LIGLNFIRGTAIYNITGLELKGKENMSWFFSKSRIWHSWIYLESWKLYVPVIFYTLRLK